MSSDRFTSLDEHELQNITEARDLDNTKNVTKNAVMAFRPYLTAKKVSVYFESFSNAELDTKVCMLNSAIQRENNTSAHRCCQFAVVLVVTIRIYMYMYLYTVKHILIGRHSDNKMAL
jgi:hypothetical protein